MAMSSSSFNLSSSFNSYLFRSAWTFSQTVLTQTLANSSFMCGSHSCLINSISSLYPFIPLSLVQGFFARYGSDLNPHQISKKISTLYLVPEFRQSLRRFQSWVFATWSPSYRPICHLNWSHQWNPLQFQRLVALKE